MNETYIKTKPFPEALADLALGIDHIALAVPDLEASIHLYESVLGFELVTRQATQGERTGMISAVLRGNGVCIVLVQGTEPESQVSRFLQEKGPGVQHVAIRVRNLDRACALLQEAGVEFITPVLEGDGTRQVFTSFEPSMGVRLELIERTKEGFARDTVRQLFLHMERQGIH